MITHRGKTGRSLKEKKKRTRRETLTFFLPIIALTVIGFFIAFQFVDPAPPRAISIACGPQEGANCIFANSYAEFMASEGVTLNIRATAGSVENLELLQVENDGVEVAFVQGGLQSLVQNEHLVSLGSLYFEPLWIFYRNGLVMERISDMKGLRIAVGKEGSGTKILAMHLLRLNGIDSENTSLVSVGSQAATGTLLNGDVDVAFFVSTHSAPYVAELIDSRSVTLMGMPRAEAYTFLYHYLYLLRVPEGVIDLEANIPSRNLNLVASTTQLVARPDLHPALVNLLMQASDEVHEAGTEFERQGEFPSPSHLDFELSDEAERYFKTGPPFLQRYLPFWVANFISRMMIMLVPLIVIFFPLFKVIPPLYVWRMRRRVYRWYSDLEAVDPDLHGEDLAENLQGFLLKLDEIEAKVASLAVPPGYSEGLYALRVHIELLRKKLRDAAQEDEGTDKQTPAIG
jgi:TRAP transporter TAXI family solute receptor